MGANSPSTTQYAHKLVASLKSFFELLPPSVSYRQILKRYTEYIMKHRAAIHYATGYLPILAALIVIQVERDLSHAHTLLELRREIDELRREIKKPANPE
jgi:hypothetical protein